MHSPVAFAKVGSNIGENLFPLLKGKNEPDGDVDIDDKISISDTWKGKRVELGYAITALTKISMF